MRTQVGIVGAGPAGLTLALLLQREGIESVILEARDRDYVERRVRAGLLEQNTVDLMHELGVGERLAREGLTHNGIYLRRQGHTQRIRITELTGRHVTIYGQQEVVKDLIAAWFDRGGELHFEVSDVELHGIDTDRPSISFRKAGAAGHDRVRRHRRVRRVPRRQPPDDSRPRARPARIRLSVRLARHLGARVSGHRRAHLRVARARFRPLHDALGRRQSALSSGSGRRATRRMVRRPHLGGAPGPPRHRGVAGQ